MITNVTIYRINNIQVESTSTNLSTSAWAYDSTNVVKFWHTSWYALNPMGTHTFPIMVLGPLIKYTSISANVRQLGCSCIVLYQANLYHFVHFPSIIVDNDLLFPFHWILPISSRLSTFRPIPSNYVYHVYIGNLKLGLDLFVRSICF